MTTLTRGDRASAPSAGEGPEHGGSKHAGSEREDSRWAQWWSSWRVAIRMGRRDVRRHRGRSTLIAVMVAFPMVVVIGGVIVLASQQIDNGEQAPLVLGHAVASIRVDGTLQIDQLQVYSDEMRSVPPPPASPATPVPGWGVGHEGDAVAQLVGSPAARVTTSTVRADLGNRSIAVGVLGLDIAKAPYLVGRATLISGRWPAGSREVIVTRTGIQHGLPTSGTVALRVKGAEVPFTVVGVGDGYQWMGYDAPRPADLVSLPDATGVVPDGQTSGGTGTGMSGVQYLVDRSTPLSDNEIRRINTYGLNVFQVGLPTVSVADNGAAFAGGAALAAAGLFLLTSLLAGPAFAVSAARQRRTLALGASNGATPRQLRRTVLGQALVLGVLAAVCGVGIGIGAGWGVTTWLNAHQPDTFYGPFDLPFLPVAIVLVSAVLSSVIAALLPSRGLGRLDIVGVLRGQDVSPALHRGLPVLRLALVGSGSGLLVWGFVLSRRPTQVVATIMLIAGATGLVVGALCVIPTLLAVTGRLTRNLPVTIRMATRDAARQRGRATPTVAAVMIGTALLTTLLVGLGSDARYRELTYHPSIPSGTATVLYDPSGMRAGGTDPVQQIQRTVAAAAPDLVVTETGRVDSNQVRMAAAEDGRPMSRVPQLVGLRTGCTTNDVVTDRVSPTGPSGRCLSLDSSYGAFHSAVLTAPAGYLARSLDLTADQQSRLATGALVVVDGSGKPPTVIAQGDGGTTSDSGDAAVDVVGGAVSLSLYQSDPATGAVVGEPQLQQVPAIVIPRARFDTAFPNRQYGAVVATETASRLGWPTVTEGVYLVDPRGPIDEPTEAAVQKALDAGAAGANLYVERGYTPDTSTAQMTVGATAIVALVILFATLIATALSQAEGQNMMSTLAAVGATLTTRRRLAAAQAGSLALIGAALGTLLGLVPGIVAAWSETSRSYVNEPTAGPVIVVPWLQLLPTLVAVPLLAAALAWVSIRRSPAVTRRLT